MYDGLDVSNLLGGGFWDGELGMQQVHHLLVGAGLLPHLDVFNLDPVVMGEAGRQIEERQVVPQVARVCNLKITMQKAGGRGFLDSVNVSQCGKNRGR